MIRREKYETFLNTPFFIYVLYYIILCPIILKCKSWLITEPCGGGGGGAVRHGVWGGGSRVRGRSTHSSTSLYPVANGALTRQGWTPRKFHRQRRSQRTTGEIPHCQIWLTSDGTHSQTTCCRDVALRWTAETLRHTSMLFYLRSSRWFNSAFFCILLIFFFFILQKDNVKTHEVEVDIDELLDMDSDEHRRHHLNVIFLFEI